MGYVHFPRKYRGKVYEHSVSDDRLFSPINFNQGDLISCNFNILIAPSENNFSYENALKVIYGEIHEPPLNMQNREEAITQIVGALVDETYNHEYNFFPPFIRVKLLQLKTRAT